MVARFDNHLAVTVSHQRSERMTATLF